jgi:hypothetical protein
MWTVGNSMENDIYLLKVFSIFETAFIVTQTKFGKMLIKDVSCVERESIPLFRLEKNVPFPIKTGDVICFADFALFSVAVRTETRIKIQFKGFYDTETDVDLPKMKDIDVAIPPLGAILGRGFSSEGVMVDDTSRISTNHCRVLPNTFIDLSSNGTAVLLKTEEEFDKTLPS